METRFRERLTDQRYFFQLPSKATVMISGAEADCERFVRKLAKHANLGTSLPDLIKDCEEEYQKTREELIEIRILKPNFITAPELHIESVKPEQNEFIKDLVKKATSFELNCSVILCGFDADGTPFIVGVDGKGEAYDYSRIGYQAIGSGSQYSLARLSCWSEWERRKPVDQCLFFVLDAKIAAEADPFIGGDWDAVVITTGNYTPVPKPLVSALDKAWVKYNRSPYWERDQDDLDDPPETWEQDVAQWVSTTLSISQASAGA
jgi:20S proteasome alpha/beta subunit